MLSINNFLMPNLVGSTVMAHLASIIREFLKLNVTLIFSNIIIVIKSYNIL